MKQVKQHDVAVLAIVWFMFNSVWACFSLDPHFMAARDTKRTSMHIQLLHANIVHAQLLHANIMHAQLLHVLTETAPLLPCATSEVPSRGSTAMSTLGYMLQFKRGSGLEHKHPYTCCSTRKGLDLNTHTLIFAVH